MSINVQFSSVPAGNNSITNYIISNNNNNDENNQNYNQIIYQNNKLSRN